VDQLIKKADQLERDRLAEIEAKRNARINTNAYVNYRTAYFEESLSSRSDTNDCKTGCIGGKPMTIWEMIFPQPRSPAPAHSKTPPLKITPSVRPSRNHIY